MRRALAGALLVVLAACGPATSGPDSAGSPSASSVSENADATAPQTSDSKENANMMLRVNGHELRVSIVDNSSAKALCELVGDGEIEIAMRDYGGFEKVGSLPAPLPTNDERITTQAGDVILYQGNQLVIYYDTNTWEFTRLGRIDGVDADELRSILGAGSVSVTIECQ